MGILKDLEELQEANVISSETAQKIEAFYEGKKTSPQKRLYIVFGILGAILVGLGINLIIAHNWDDFSRATKSVIAFMPLLIGQAACGYVILKRRENTAWREGSSAFLVFGVGASISLISQIYNIPGDLGAFLLTWVILVLPLVYLMKSSITSLLYLSGITWYACEVEYWTYGAENTYYYWLLLLAVLPHYYLLYKKKPKSNFMTFHNWMVPLSLVITLGTLAESSEEIMFVSYISLFGVFYLLGDSQLFAKQKLINNGYTILGALGTLSLLMTLSFEWFWDEIKPGDIVLLSPEAISAVVLTGLASYLLILQLQKKNIETIKPLEITFAAFFTIFVIGVFSEVSYLLMNLLIFAIGILTIRNGAKQDHLGVLNFGLIIITILAACRFFDDNISFILRGLMFLIAGVGFFVVNSWMIRRRKIQEAEESIRKSTSKQE